MYGLVQYQDAALRVKYRAGADAQMVEYFGADDGAHAQRGVRHEQCDEAGNDLGTTRAGGHQRRAGNVVGNLAHVAYHRERRHEALFADHAQAPEDDSYCYDEQCAQQLTIHCVYCKGLMRRAEKF